MHCCPVVLSLCLLIAPLVGFKFIAIGQKWGALPPGHFWFVIARRRWGVKGIPLVFVFCNILGRRGASWWWKNCGRGRWTIGTLNIIPWTSKICDHGKFYKCSTWRHTRPFHWFDGKQYDFLNNFLIYNIYVSLYCWHANTNDFHIFIKLSTTPFVQ
jgi:hypothetical protein